LAIWDVFHSDRLEVERGLDDAALRAAIDRGDVIEGDLIRPAGSGSPWERLADRPDIPATLAPTAVDLAETTPPAPLQTDPLVETEWDVEMIRKASSPGPAPEPDRPADDGIDFEKVDPEASEPAVFAFAQAPKRPDADVEGLEFLEEEEDIDGLEFLDDAASHPPADAPAAPIHARPAGPILPPYEESIGIPVPGPAPLPWDAEVLDAEFDDDDEAGEEEYDPLEEDEAVAEFTLTRGAAERVEERDQAAIGDVAFQLVLFFLVTATTVFYKSLEVPAPKPDKPPDAAQQSRSKTLDELMKDEILVEIDPGGTLKIDRQVVPGALTMPMLADKLRQLRNDTGRKGMLLSADFTTPHRLTTLAYDAANEVGMNIKIASPTNKAAPAPPPAKKG
jgi:biopolymer transport protein ExbD